MRTRKALSAAACAALLSAAFAATPAWAVPDSPPRAEVTQIDGCSVSADGIVYTSDPTCRAHLVTRVDANGELQIYSYHDHGQLPDDVAPDSAERRTFVFGGLECSEIVTPSGEYMSNCFYR